MSAINEHDKYIASLENRIAKYQAELERLQAIEEAAQGLGLAVYSLYNDLAGDHSLDIGTHEQILRDAYDALAAALEKK